MLHAPLRQADADLCPSADISTAPLYAEAYCRDAAENEEPLGEELDWVLDAAIKTIKKFGVAKVDDVAQMCSGAMTRMRVYLTVFKWVRIGVMAVEDDNILISEGCLRSDCDED